MNRLVLAADNTVGSWPAARLSAELILAFQWADTEDMAAFRTDQKAHRHR